MTVTSFPNWSKMQTKDQTRSDDRVQTAVQTTAVP